MSNLNANKIRKVLKKVEDPEIGINIVDLGLIYGIKTIGKEIQISMTLTSMGCQLGPQIMQNIEDVLKDLFPESLVKIELVWEPAWNENMISKEIRDQLP